MLKGHFFKKKHQFFSFEIKHLMFFFILGVALARTKRNPERLTAYACESSRLNISCSAGQYLDIIRANYGRFSITICNDHGNTDWKVDCQAGRTLRAMQAR